MQRFAARLSRSRDDADDLGQEACVRFLTEWAVFDGVHLGRFAGWMVLHARKRIEAQRRRTAAGPLVSDPPGQDPDGPPAFERAEQTRRVRAAVARLPERRRDIITHRYGLDDADPVTLQDLAGGLGVSRQAVHEQERKALAQLAADIATNTPTREAARVIA
jgi:RNA polymerase sigma factor (sigma-70 family)